MKKLFILIVPIFAWLICAQTNDPLRNLGMITIEKGITWDDDPRNGTNVVGYDIFLTDYGKTNFAKVASVSTNRWLGDPLKAWTGPKVLFITAIDRGGFVSDPSEIVLAEFRAGVPYSPRNIQIYEVVNVAATNALMVVTNSPTPPSP